MFRQLVDLEDTIHKLKQIESLYTCMCDNYFQMREPDKGYFVASYEDLQNIIDVIREMTTNQQAALNDTTNRLYDIYWELKKVAEQNISLLSDGIKGGDSNG